MYVYIRIMLHTCFTYTYIYDRVQNYQLELFELILSLTLDKQLPVERFEATAHVGQQ